MLKSLKKALAALMVVIMTLTSIPLQGFVDFELPQWFSFDAEAVDTETVVNEEVSLSGTDTVPADVEETEAEDNKSFLDRIALSDTSNNIPKEYLEILKESNINDSHTTDRGPMLFSVAPFSDEEEPTEENTAEEQPTSGTINETITWEFDSDTKTLTISGEGEIPAYYPKSYYEGEDIDESEMNLAPWESLMFDIEKLVIGEGITSIGDLNFYLAVNLKEITFNEGLKSIGRGCFAMSVDIRVLSFPSTLESIGMLSFAACMSLEELYLNEGLKSLGEMSFGMLYSLKKAYFPSTLEACDIEECTFFGAPDITINCTLPIELAPERLFSSEGFEYYIWFMIFEAKLDLGAILPAEELENLTEEELILIITDDFNKHFGTEYTFEEMVAIVDPILENFDDETQYCADKNLVVKLCENAGTHDVCRDKFIRHTVGDSEEECNCFVFSGDINDNISWSIDKESRTLTLSGSGEFPADMNRPGLYSYANDYIDNLVFDSESTITDIGPYSFRYMDIINVEVPGTVTIIKHYSFADCRKLSSFEFTGSLSSCAFWSHVFYGCSSLKELVLPERFYWIGDQALINSGIEKLVIKERNCHFDELDAIDTIPENTVIYGYRDSTAETYAKTNGRVFKSLEVFTVEDLVYKVGKVNGYDKDVVTITGYNGKAENIAIPEKLENSDVVAIDDEAFKDNRYIEYVTLPESVTIIGQSAFSNSTLKEITITNKQCTIADESAIPEAAVIYGYINSKAEEFANKYNRTFKSIDEFTVDNLEYEIGKLSGFDGDVVTITGYNGKAETVTIPEQIEGLDVVRIGNSAFKSNKYIRNLILSDTLKTIEYYAFENTLLETVKFGKNISKIYNNAFNGCEKLKSVYIADFETWNRIDFNQERANPLFYAENLYFGEELVTELVIPENITKIANYSFIGYKGLTSVTIPEGVTEIGSYAFAKTNIAEIVIPSTVTSMYCAFLGTSNLSDVTFTQGLKVIPANAFNGCSGLTSITIPDFVTDIKSSAFYNCASLETVYIGSGINKMESSAFSDCENLKDVYIESISSWLGITFSGSTSNPLYYAENLYVNGVVLEELNVPETVTAIKDYAFYNYAKLSKVTLPQGITKLGDHAFYKSSVKEIFIPKTVTSIYRPFGSNEVLEKVVFEAGISKITYYAFESCKALTSVVIPEGVTEIGYYAFYNCVKLQNVVLPQSLVTIGYYAFYGCDSIIEIVIPDAVTNIGSYAFCSCDKLENVTIGKNVKTVNDGAFDSRNIKNVYAYDIASWAEINFSTATANPMHYGENFYLGGELIGSEIVIPEGVTRISNYAFFGFENLTSVKLSSTVTYIGIGSFRGCKNLEKVELSDNLKGISSYAFYGCEKIDSISLGDNVITVDSYAFMNCSGLESVTFGERIARIEGYAFRNCTSLTEVILPDSLQQLIEGAFKGCTAIETVIFGDGISGIGSSAFEGCENIKEVYVDNLSVWLGIHYNNRTGNPVSYGAKLYVGGEEITDVVIPEDITRVNSYAFTNTGITSLHIGKQVKEINGYAFEKCENLRTVTVENGIKYLDRYSFLDCTSLENIVLPDTVTSVDEYCFSGCTSLKTAVLSNKITYVQPGTFYNCSSLISIEIPNSVSSIGSKAFANCTSLKSAVIGFDTTSIQSDAFNGCTDLTIYGVAGTAAETFALQKSIPFKTLGDVLTLNVTDEEGETVEEGFTVYWYDSEENVVGTGIYLGNISFGETYTYKVVLGEELSKVYKVPEDGSITTDIETTSTALVLEKLPMCTVSGTVKDLEGNNLAGAKVTIIQIFADTYEDEVELTTDENGQFTATVPFAVTNVKYEYEGYYTRNRKVNLDTENALDISTELTKLPDNKISLSMKVKKAVVAGDEERVYDLSSANNLSFEVYDITLDEEITEFVVQYPYIILTDERIRPEDIIEISVVDTKNTMKAENAKVVLDEKTQGYAEIEFSENGKIAVNNLTGSDKVNVLIFDKDGKYLESKIVDASLNRAYTGGILPDGNYKVVCIKNTTLLQKVSTLSNLDKFGFVAGKDYILNEVAVANGEVTVLEGVKVPDFDESGFYYTVEKNTSFDLSDPSAVTGKYLTMKLSYEIDSKYASSNQKVIITLPEGVDFADGSLTVDGKKATYNFENGVLSINTNKRKAVIRFYIVATAAGTHAVNAELSFKNDGSAVSQPLGSATFEVINSKISVPEKTAEKEVVVFGTAIPNSTVKMFDNGTEVGTTTANKNGSWSMKFSLVDAFSYSYHAIYAEITTKGIDGVVTTDPELLEYNVNYIDLSKITVHNDANRMVFDFRSDSTVVPTYTFVPSRNTFTFVVEFTDNDPERIEDVKVITTSFNGEDTVVDCTYDEVKGAWIGAQKYTSGNVPCSVNADFYVKDADKIVFDDDITMSAEEHIEDLQAEIAEAVEYGDLEYKEISLSNVANVYSDEFIQSFEYSEETGYGTRLLEFNVDFVGIKGKGYASYSIEKVTGFDTTGLFHFTDEESQDFYIINDEFSGGIVYGVYNASTQELMKIKSANSIHALLTEGNNTRQVSRSASSSATTADIWINGIGLAITIGAFLAGGVPGFLAASIIMAPIIFGSGWNAKEKLKDDFDDLKKDMEEHPECYAGLEDEIGDIGDQIDDMLSFGQMTGDAFLSMIGPYTNLGGLVSGVAGGGSAVRRHNLSKKIEDLRRQGGQIAGGGGNIAGGGIPSTGGGAPSTGGGAAGGAGGAGGNSCGGEPDPKNNPKTAKPSIDPSGYVYEAVPSNRVEGVKVEAYYYDYPVDEFGVPGEEKEEILWDASEYDQINPLYTDMNGQYAWDVPPGQWLVKYSKDGYYDTDSRNDPAADEDGYLPVPPPQVEVNTAIVSKAAPEVKSVNIYEESIQIIFSQYMKPATVNGDTVKVLCDGEAVTGTFAASDAEYNYEETEQFASIYTFTPESAFEGTVSVTIDDAVNYAGKAMTSEFATETEAEVEPEGISVPEKVTVEYNAETTVAIAVQPAEAGANKTLTVTSEIPDRVSVVTEKVTTDTDGKANITLKGNLPGNCIINVLLDGTDITASFEVEVGNVVAEKIKCEKVTANIASGTAVEAGTEITLSTTTEGAEIYYTLDGTCPCVVGSESRLHYTGPITVNEDTFIIAYAVKSGCDDSATAGFVYSIDTTCKHRELEFIAEVPAACDVSGTKAYYECESCSKKFSDADGKTEITDILISAKGHSWKNPTCTTAKTCSVCGATEGNALGHKWTAATCTTAKTCSVCKVTEGKALGHKETILKAVASTCTKTGLTEGKKCTVCGVITVKQNTVAKKAHTYKNVTTKATLSKNGKVESKCSVCGYVKSTTTVYYPKTIQLSNTAYTYNGKVQTPTVTVKDSKGNTLKKDTDYTVKYESGRKSPGKYTVTITFKGKYSGTKKLTYTIAPKKVTKLSATQTTTTITLKWSKVTGADAYRVYKYNTKTKKYEKLKDVTKTTLKISKLKAGTAYKYKVRAYTKDDGTIYGAYSDVFETATKCKTPSISKLTTTKGKASFAWSNVSGESGYQVYYSTKKDSGYKKVASYKTNVVKGSKSKLKSGKTYYFKVRAYKKTASGTVYSAWSAVKSVKVK